MVTADGIAPGISRKTVVVPSGVVAESKYAGVSVSREKECPGDPSRANLQEG